MSMPSARLGSLAGAAASARDQFRAERALRRLWARDASLWKSDEKAKKIIANALGWLTVTELVRPHVGELEALSSSVRAGGFRHAVLLGMGGSSLCTEVMRLSDLPDPSAPTMLVLDSTVPAAVARIEKTVDPATTLFIVASKSGGTAETAAFYAYFFDVVKRIKGDRAGENFVAITDSGTHMESQARGDRFREVRINPSDIGGRYSALSYFGLLPAALMGVDLNAYLDRADAAVASCRSESENPGLELGAILGGLASQGRDKLTLITPEPLAALGLWIEQLVAESTGKEGKGILPVAGEPLGPPDVYGNDRLFVRVRVEGQADSANDAKLQALQAAGHPVVEHVLPSSMDLGAEFFRWEIATALAGQALGINPFDQPNVQESKDNTIALLDEFARAGRFSEPGVVAEFDGLTLSADDANRAALGAAAGSTTGRERFLAALKAHFGRVKPGDYVAITQYIDERPERDEAILALRLPIRDRLRVATTTGYGPRFLHSTGQLHKGGPDTGVFLQITADEGQGQPIPGKPYDFATLVQAQSLGDLKSLTQRNRRAVRVHLGANVDAGLAKLRELIDEARPSPTGR
jgi:glucose-6-phosphate isomerase